MAKIFIRRPVLAMVISLVLLLIGGIAIPKLPIAQYPEITPPTVMVAAFYTGANAKTVAEAVAAPIEQQLNGAENMLYMQSKSTNDGRMLLTVTFEVGTNPDMAQVDVQNRVNRATANLPQSVLQNGVTVKKQSTQILLFITLSSPDNTLDALFLSNYATINIVDQLARVNGVSDVAIAAGKRDYGLRVWVEPDRMAKMGITASDINNALREQNTQAPAGQIGQPPVNQNLDFQYSVSVKGQLTSVEDFENVIIKTLPNGSVVRIRDVARVEMGAQDYSSVGRLNGKVTIPISVNQSPGANAITVAKELRAKMKELARSFPAGMTYDISFDSTMFVTASIEEVVKTLWEAIVLVLIVVFVFLGSGRATLIPMLAVPVSLVATFGAFIALGFSINMLTLFGIVLAVGIVVDDAIVVVEAVEHHIERGLPPFEATEKAMDEVSGPVIAIALVLSAVFIPVAFIGGITGQLYRQFAVTLAVSVCLSALVALTLTPALCALMLRHRTEMGGPLGWFLRAFNRVFGWVTDVYIACVKAVIRFWWVALIVLAGFYGAVAWLGTTLPGSFLPAEDNGYFVVDIRLPDAASLERTDAVMKRAEDLILKNPAVHRTVCLGGNGAISGTIGPNLASIYVILKPWEERGRADESAFAIIRKLQQQFATWPEAIIGVFNPPAIPGLGSSGGFTFELENRSGMSTADFGKQYESFVTEAGKSPVLSPLFASYAPDVPQVDLQVDREKVKILGIPLTDVFQTLQTYLGGMYINQFTRFGRTWRVYVQAAAKFRLNPEDIGAIYVRSMSNRMIPLKTITTIRRGTGPDTILRYNLYESVEINGQAMPGFSSGQAMAAMEAVVKKMPTGIGCDWTGTALQEKISGGTQGPVFALALLMVFLFLAALYESWGVPFAVLLGIPLGVFGAFGFVMLQGYTNDIYVQVGLVMLIGLAAKNAILIVEVAKAEYEKGQPLVEAAVEAARLRFRPILMTSFAFILGVLPLLTAAGAGAASRHSLGSAVFGGMLAATCLGVFFTPMLYVVVQTVTELPRRFLGKKGRRRHGHDPDAPDEGPRTTRVMGRDTLVMPVDEPS